MGRNKAGEGGGRVEIGACYFIEEIREDFSNNVTWNRLLKESCEYLGELSRKREQPG